MERMKVERNRAGNKYTLTPEDEKDEKLLDRIAQLEEENEKLKEEKEILKKLNLGERMEYLKYIKELEEENKRLKEENEELKEYKSMYEGLCK